MEEEDVELSEEGASDAEESIEEDESIDGDEPVNTNTTLAERMRLLGDESSEEEDEEAGEELEGDSDKPGDDTIVIHPGSRNLILGKGSHATPFLVPHVIARRLHEHRGMERRGSESTIAVTPGEDTLREEAYAAAERVINTVHDPKHPHRTRQRMGTNLALLTPFNSQAVPKPMPGSSPAGDGQGGAGGAHTLAGGMEAGEAAGAEAGDGFTDVSSKPAFVVGEDALSIAPKEPYRLFWPMKGLGLNTSTRYSEQAAISDIVTIWREAIHKYLRIPPSALPRYRMIIIVPDHSAGKLSKFFINLALKEFGCEAALVHQESLSATFGSGIAVGCVVSVGDCKTSVACVEDGSVLPETCVALDYGGRDLLASMLFVLKKVAFSYTTCSLNNQFDRDMLRAFIESKAHYSLDSNVIETFQLQGKRDDGVVLQYSVKMAEQLTAAVMGFYFPGLFGLKDASRQHFGLDTTFDPEDGVHELVMEDIKKQAKTSAAGSSVPTVPSSGAATAPSPVPMETASVSAKPVAMQSDVVRGLMSLDEAIFHSIMQVEKDATKQKLFECILVTGGCSLLRSFPQFLRDRVVSKLPLAYTRLAENVQVIFQPKDIDARFLSWKGGSVMSQLDAAQECFIERDEWNEMGPRLVRERLPFSW